MHPTSIRPAVLLRRSPGARRAGRTLLLACLLTPAAAHAQPPAAAVGTAPPAGAIVRPTYAATDRAEDVLRRFDTWLGAMAAADSFSGVVAIARDGRIVTSRVAGIADRRTNAPNTLDTRFTIASMGKMFTAIAIAQLVERGRLAVTDTVGRHLPDFPMPDVARRVTIEQLLTHTSGLGTYFNPQYDAARASLYRVADYVPLFSGEPLRFAPGERWEYSNAGYVVLGRVIEAVTGTDFYEHVRREVLARAGMRSSGYYNRSGETPGGAVGYYRAPDGTFRDHLAQRELRGSPAGGGYSTAGDLVAFMDALAKDRLVRAATREQFTTGRVDGPFGPKRYAYGFILRPARDSVFAFGHTGGFPGTVTQAFHYTRSGHTLVVLLNRSGPEVNAIMSEAARAMAELQAAARRP